MNSGPQHKMYNLEIPPPPGVWEKIAAELDESELSQQFPSTLYNTEVVPPVHVWSSIATALDESEFVNDYAAKLLGVEVAPAPAVWNKIKNNLVAENETAIPERRRIFPFIKYAVAASVIAFVAWGGMQLFNNKKNNTPVAIKNSPVTRGTETVDQTVTIPQDIIDQSSVSASLDEARNDAALEESKKTYAKVDFSVTKNKLKDASNFFFAADYDHQPGTRGLDFGDDEIQSTDIADRYIMLMTPDGKIIRISKKLSNLVCCVSGEEQDKDCIDQMKKWRDKISNPSTHPAGNFMDILNMVSSLQDN